MKLEVVSVESVSIEFFCHNRLVPESLRWLVSQKKYDEAAAVVKRAAKFNGLKVPQHLLHTKDEHLTLIVSGKDSTAANGVDNHGNTGPVESQTSSSKVESNEQLKKRYTFLDMFRTPKLRMRSILLFYVW